MKAVAPLAKRAEHHSMHLPTRGHIEEPSDHIPTSQPFSEFPIYRKAACPCGGGCPACQAKSSDLKISQPNDPAEIEADQIADRVMRMPVGDSKLVQNAVNADKTIHRACDTSDDKGDKIQGKALSVLGNIPSQTSAHVQHAIGSGGHPLDPQMRSFFEPRLGYDLSSVRIHTDSTAGQSARAIDARAYTLGSNIVFGSGEYKPESETGRHLIAHELAHVLQQNGSPEVLSKSPIDESVSVETPSEGGTPIPQTDVTDDPCTYRGRADKEREIHLNLSFPAIRVYRRDGSGYTTTQFDNIIIGPSTSQVARQNGWCHMYPVQGHQRRSSTGLINFVNYCGHFGFHSNFWRKNGGIERIPGTQSHGCARLHDADAASTGSGDSNSFFNMIQDGDCVRLYRQDFWRVPTFKPCRSDADCTLD